MPDPTIEAMARAICEEQVRQDRDNEAYKCPAGEAYYEEEIAPYQQAQAAAEIDDALQAIHDARMLRGPGTYAEAYEAGDVLREAAAIATEARRAETTGSVHEGAGPKDIAQPEEGSS
jgi:hypothetical protein